MRRRLSSNPFVFHKKEIQYLERWKEYPDNIYVAHPNSVQEGFEYLFAIKPDLRPIDRDFQNPTDRMRRMGLPIRAMPRMMNIFRNIQKGTNQSWEDTEQYFGQFEPSDFEEKPELWKELNGFVQKWNDVRLGFTELPQQMIFKGKFTLFRYAFVVSQEMKKDKIDQAPEFQAGQEVMRVYGSLGLVVNEIARWLRRRGMRCQSNHPLGGLTNTPSLAGKAGMGWQGRSGLLITPEFGPRVRLAPVFIEHKYFEFTDNREHDWIENYCELCQRCEKECPGQAIYSEKVVTIEDVPGIGAIRTCIDREKCFEYFIKSLGCSVCVKVCPFSKGEDIYQQLKSIV
jgi:NAD-dependent dihydropyrimidine dehydrogenase PreA subunit